MCRRRDLSTIIHPQNYRAQAEGGILFGLSSLGREDHVVGGLIDQSNFYDYVPIRIGKFSEVEFTESGADPRGGGKIGVPMTGAAVVNSIRAETGKYPQNISSGGDFTRGRYIGGSFAASKFLAWLQSQTQSSLPRQLPRH